MNIIQLFENLFGGGKPPAVSKSFQEGINVAGKALDEAEAIVTTLQGVSNVLPGPFQGYLAALAVAVHGLDTYVDSLETPQYTIGIDPAHPPVAPAPQQPPA